MYSFPHLTNNKIAVLGDVMLDHYLFGNCERISPEAPVPVVDVKGESFSLGGAGNVLKNLASFGCPAFLLSVCGDDDGAKILKNEIANASPYFFNLISDPKRQTTIKTRVLASKHQLIRLDRENKFDIDNSIADSLINEFKGIISEIKVLIISDYCKGVVTEYLAGKIIELCKQHNVYTIVDSKNPILKKYYNINVFKPNKKEASRVSGIEITDDETLKLACINISAKINCETLIITLSEEGMAIYHDKELVKIPTRALEVFDVTGAGDTVIASIAFALANGSSIYEACEFSNRAAAVVVGKIGTATATLPEINKL